MINKKWQTDLAKDTKVMNKIAEEIEPYVHEEKRMAVELIFEEIFTNIARYAYTNESSKPVEVSFTKIKRMYFLTFSDKGTAFDPTLYIPCDPDGTQIGGHGIRLVKALCEHMVYKREDEKNILKIII